MSEIKKGDLVMVVRGKACGCPSNFTGVPFVVERIIFADTCYLCGVEHPLVETACGFGGSARIEVWRLIKIDPPQTGDEASDRVPLPHELGKVRQRETVK